MMAVAYVLPVIACILLHFVFDYDGDWTAYLWVMIFGEGTVGALHWFFYDLHTSSTEYLGSIVSDITHEDDWIELVEVKETKTDSNGRTCTVTRVEERYHKEKYYMHTSRGSMMDIDRHFYSYVRSVWKRPGHDMCWSGRHIKGGVRRGMCFRFSDFNIEERDNPDNWVPVTESGSYTNKVRASNSIFKFEAIGKREAAELGLLDYPAIQMYDAPCLLSDGIPVPDAVDKLFRKFNAVYAPEYQMRLYILLFQADKGIGISERQRSYWQGGNKNEFIVCIGMNPDGKIEWARAFSWADVQDKEVDAAQWLMLHPCIDWQEFHDWLRWHIVGWKRKEFKDFDYIHVELPLWQFISVIGLSAAENALALYLALN